MTEYKYKYYLATQKWPNTNIIRLPNNNGIQISFGFPKMNKFENKFCSASQKEGLQYQFWVSQGDAKFAKSSDDWSQLQIQNMTHQIGLWYMRMNYSFGAQRSFGSTEYLKKNTHPLIFSEDLLIRS